MRYRKLTADGDYSFGSGSNDYHVDTPETVAQAILTRMRLWTGQWWLNLSEGTPYQENVLGKNYKATADYAIRQRILGTPSVVKMTNYASSISESRKISVTCTVDTAYGTVNLESAL